MNSAVLRSAAVVVMLLPVGLAHAQFLPVVPKDRRGQIDAERSGTHDAASIRTVFYNYGMVGDYPADPGNVDLSVFHSVEVPKGTGMNYSDGITPFVLSRVVQSNGAPTQIMETGYRERQGVSPFTNKVMRFEPRPGYFQADPAINAGRSPAISNDPRTWPNSWPDRVTDPDDPGWSGSWDGYFGKRPAADQESFTVMDDDFYDAWLYWPDSRDSTRRGLGLRIEVRGFQWANPQSANVIFWHYDIANESTTDYDDNIIFGLYMDSGVGGSALSCDGVYESDDDNAFFDKSLGLNLTYTWDKLGHGKDLFSNCGKTGYLGYAYLETPGNPFDGVDNDEDGILNEVRDGGPGVLIEGQDAIRGYFNANYNVAVFEQFFGKLETRPAYRAGRWWTGDENFTWVAELSDFGTDGVAETGDTGEGDGIPTSGEPNFDRTDLYESDQIGLTGFAINRIKAGTGAPPEVDNIVFFDEGKHWPQRLYDKFTDPVPGARFDSALFLDYNIGFLFASGPFRLKAGKVERFSLALAYGADLVELETTVKLVQQIYNANYQFAVPPPAPTVLAEVGDRFVKLTWDDEGERGIDPVTLENDFEGYRIYRSTDPEFRDPRVIVTGRGTGPIGNGKPIAQFDLVDRVRGYSKQVVEGVAYWLGTDAGLAHAWVDTTVTNGQNYYYAVCAYDFGSDSLGFYPSENAIAVSRTPRGGTILPKNVVEVRPNPKVAGFVPASVSNATQAAGNGVGTVQVLVANSTQVPDNHVFKLVFGTFGADSVRANYYDLIDSTTGAVVFTRGYDLNGEKIGQVGLGLQPVVTTPAVVTPDTARQGFTTASQTNMKLWPEYRSLLPQNLKRPGYPDELRIEFANVPLDTSLRGFGLLRSRPTKFRVLARGDSADLQLDFYFLDNNNDSTLSAPGEYVDVVTYQPSAPTTVQTAWRISVDTTGMPGVPITRPGPGDVYELKLLYPFTTGDLFVFTTTAEFLDPTKAQVDAQTKPYVVPNPYVASAAFEPERFAVSGRGERRLEFRAVPRNAVIRIYTVRGELVQTLYQDGSTNGFVPWNLRTKDNLDVAPGLYIYHVDAGELGTHIDKFAIIK